MSETTCKNCGKKTVVKGRLVINDDPIRFEVESLRNPKLQSFACTSCGFVEIGISQGEWHKVRQLSIEVALRNYVSKKPLSHNLTAPVFKII